MKLKHLILIALGTFALNASAGEPVRLNIESGAYHPVLSPDGKTVLYSTKGQSEMKMFDIASKQSRRIASSHETTNSDQFGVTSYVTPNTETINVTIEGETKSISPIANGRSYLWASLSPDATRIVFTESYTGVNVSDINGENVTNILPQGTDVDWVGPQTIIAVISEDDGHFITKSQLVSVNIATGIINYLTPEDVLVNDATASANGIVVYTIYEGDMYMLNLNAQ